MNGQSVRGGVFIEPSYSVYNGDRLFDINDPVLNREGTLLPMWRLRERLRAVGVEVHTADYLPASCDDAPCEYYSFGALVDLGNLTARPDTELRSFVIFEPPVVAPTLYDALPEISSVFERVYVHNIHGDGYSLRGVDFAKLHKLFWPQPFREVREPYWSRKDRMRRIVAINGNHRPRSKCGELYSKRIEAMSALAKFGIMDLYGRDWDKWWARTSMWAPYWRNRRSLSSIYRGACDSKYEVMSRYCFALCFENMAMDGYITEKIFDCFYAGVVPLYWGPKDVGDYIDPSTFIDCRRFNDWYELWEFVSTISSSEIETLREAGRSFVNSNRMKWYYDSLENIVMGAGCQG